MARIEVRSIKVLRNNYVFMLNHRASGAAAVVDPGIAGPVITALDTLGWRVRKILCTHHHPDSVMGNSDMRRAYGCDVYGPAGEAKRIPGITHAVEDGDEVAVGDAKGTVLLLPGHTASGIGYWFPESSSLFCGDILYPLGAGRMYEGTPEQMWSSLQKIRELPPDTKVYCAHDYLDRNVKFARSIEKDNDGVREYGAALRAQMQSGQDGAPFLLRDELRYNPFLRADEKSIQKALRMEGASAIEVFAELRRRRDDV